MKALQNIFLVIAVIAIIYLIYYYTVVSKRAPTGGSTTLSPVTPTGLGTGLTHGGSTTAPSTLPSITTGTVASTARSVLVLKQDTTPASAPNTLSGLEGISKTPITGIKQKIHFTTNFLDICPNYIWHNGVYYVHYHSETNAEGIKICYYQFNKNVLPNFITPTPSIGCDYRVYFSGVEYVYNSSAPVVTASNYLNCKYKKV